MIEEVLARMVAFTSLRSVDQGDHDWELAEFQWRRDDKAIGNV